VPSLVTSLQPFVSAGEHDMLVTFQQLVMQSVGKAASADEAKKVCMAPPESRQPLFNLAVNLGWVFSWFSALTVGPGVVIPSPHPSPLMRDT
jgi:hypothetical protein